jgi:phospholipid transport system substrate-binding protein
MLPLRPPARLPAALVLLTAVLAAWAPLSARAETDPQAARALAERLVERAHGALADPGLDEARRTQRLREAVSESFAFDIWERFLLGERAAQLNPEQQAEFRRLLPAYLADLYRRQFGQGLERKPEIREVRPARSDVLVRAEIPRENAGPLPVDWRIRGFADRGPRVIDVMVGGTSMLILKRDEFGSVLEREGPEALLSHLRERAG